MFHFYFLVCNIPSLLLRAVHGHPESRVRHWNAYMLFYEAVSGLVKSHLDRVSKSEAIG